MCFMISMFASCDVICLVSWCDIDELDAGLNLSNFVSSPNRWRRDRSGVSLGRDPWSLDVLT